MTPIEIIISEIDSEIERLEQAKRLLAGSVPAPTLTVVPTHKGISPEGRARIAKAQRRRWKALKKAESATIAAAMQQ